MLRRDHRAFTSRTRAGLNALTATVVMAMTLLGQGCWCAGEQDPGGASQEAASLERGEAGQRAGADVPPTLAAPIPPEKLERYRAELTDRDPVVREAAFRALEDAGSQEADRTLAAALRSAGDEKQQIRAIEAIEETEGEDGIAAIGETLSQQLASPATKQAAITALLAIGSEDAAQALLGGLADSDPEVRMEVVNALDFMDYPFVVHDLWLAYRSEDDDLVREHILDALETMGEDVENYRE